MTEGSNPGRILYLAHQHLNDLLGIANDDAPSPTTDKLFLLRHRAAQGFTSNCPTNPARVILSAIASCGMSAYRHGFPPFCPLSLVASSHHFTPASFLASTA